MAIDLPPVIPPQLSTVERIEAYAPASAAPVIVSVADRRLLITGNRFLKEAQIQAIAQAAATPSQAIRALSQAYYQLGHLLVTVYYAPSGSDIRVHVINARVADIQAPPAILGHFRGLIGDVDLSRADFETHRVLADLKSERAGNDYRVSYAIKDGDPEAYILQFTPQAAADVDPLDLILQLGNQGNRFLGRYFAGAGIKQRLDNGLELSVSYETAITDWGETQGGKNYDGYQLQANYPSRWGLYGVEATHITYELEATTVQAATTSPPLVEIGGTLLCSLFPALCSSNGTLSSSSGFVVQSVLLDAEVNSLALTGEQVLYSDAHQRLTTSQRLERIETEIDIRDGDVYLDEPYTSFELGGRYYRNLSWLQVPSRLSLQLFVEAGVSSDDGTLGTDDREDVVAQGKRTAEYLMYRPRFGMTVRPFDHLEFNLDISGQFSDGNQLPQQQQLVLGGLSTMSAYLPGILVGDSGSFSQLSVGAGEWQFWGVALKPSLFVEHGQAWYEDVRGSQGDKRSITDGGLRFSAELGRHTSMELVAAAPIADDNIAETDLDRYEVDFYWKLKAVF